MQNKKLVALVATVTVISVAVYCSVGKKPTLNTPQPSNSAGSIKFHEFDNKQPVNVFDSISKSEMQENLNYLASEELEGRMSGKRGNDLACQYIENFHKRYGLQPQLQTFTVQNVNNYKEQGSGRTSNIISLIEGSGASKGEFIVIGAHFDHIGWGPTYSRSPNNRAVHPGADDNGSGTVVLMQIAKALSFLKGKTNHSIVITHFSAEELGLVGSKYYVSHPLYPLNSTVAMINMDMVSRLKNHNNVLECIGAGSSSELSALIKKLEGKYSVQTKITNGSGGGSDHASFANQGIPVCFLHTGLHPQYHTPEDKANLADFDGMITVGKFVLDLCLELDRSSQKPNRLHKVKIGEDDVFRDHDN